MKIRIIPGKTTAQPLFAAEELIKFMSMVWNEEYSISQKAEEGTFCIFLSSGNSTDDSYSIESGNQEIRISGSNDISMLIGCYRFLEAIGFRFPAPGINILPSNPVRIEDIQVSISSSASLRHRGIAIEGANSLANVLDMIDFLPKAGFNSYFLQFEIPYTFFAKWYQHEENPLLDKEPFSQDDALRFKDEIETESAKRSLHIHSVGALASLATPGAKLI